MSSLYQVIKVQVCDGKHPNHKNPDPVGCIDYIVGFDINKAYREAQCLSDYWGKQCGGCKWAAREKQ